MSYYDRVTEKREKSRERSRHGRSENTLQKQREIDKMRRQQQYVEEKSDKPLFLQPRRMSRQDSLAKSINHVLGDPASVSGILLRDPNILLGTSRSSQGPNPASTQAQTGIDTARSKTHSNTQKSDSEHKKSKKTLPPMDQSSQVESEDCSTNCRSTEYDQKHASVSKHQCDKQGLHNTTQDSILKDNVKCQLSSDAKHFTDFPLPTDSNCSHEMITAATEFHGSDRDRVSSVDSDMIGGVENILKEMVDLPPSITDIRTPSVSEYKKFNFMPSSQRKKSDDPVAAQQGLHVAGGSGGDSSDIDSSEDDNNSQTDWNLGSFNMGSQPAKLRLHIECITSTYNKKNTDARKRDHAEYDPECKHMGPRMSSNNAKPRSSSAPVKSKSSSSSLSSQLHTSPRRASGTKETHHGTKKNKLTVKKRNSGATSGLTGADSAQSTGRKSAAKSVPLAPRHNSDGIKTNIGRMKSKGNHLTELQMKANCSTSSTSSGFPSDSQEGFPSDSQESDIDDISDKDETSSSVFHSHRKHKHVGVEIPYANCKSPRMQDSKRTSDNTPGLWDASWNNNHSLAKDKAEDLKSSRMNVSILSSENSHPHRKKHSYHAFDSTTVKPETANAISTTTASQHIHRSLWVKLRSSIFSADLVQMLNIQAQVATSPSDDIAAAKRPMKMLSTGSETEQPIRRADCVQVAVADGSTDWSDLSSFGRKKPPLPNQIVDSHHCKRQRRHKNSWKKCNRSTASDDCVADAKYSCDPTDDAELMADSVQHAHPTSSLQEEQRINSKNPLQRATTYVASVVLPDSSVPGEQERIETSDWYMREGKKMKHEGDGMVDSRTGRTRPGDALSRALAYFEASLFFIMSGYVMESENREERLETGLNSSSSTSHSPTNMYQQTLPLLDFVLKMRPHVEHDDRIFKRITISCHRCQSFLYFRIFKLKKDVAAKYSELLTEQFKTVSKSAQTHSPWRNTNAAPNVLSPLSPAVPSPFTSHGPSPASNNGDQVSSSTQAGKMTPTSHSNFSFPQKMNDMYRQHHAIMCNLLQAHEKWDKGDGLLEEHVDFFRNINALCNRTLTFHSSLRDVFLYFKMVLHQLRTQISRSPSSSVEVT